MTVTDSLKNSPVLRRRRDLGPVPFTRHSSPVETPDNGNRIHGKFQTV
jgi:hypothetical protein